MHPLSVETVNRLKHVGDLPQSVLLRYLDSNGDGSGTKDMGTTADDYYIEPGTNEIFLIERINISIYGPGSTGVPELDNYGVITALTTGCLMEIRRTEGASPSVVVLDLLDGEEIKTNGDLFRLGEVHIELGSSRSGLVFRLETRKMFGGPLRVSGNKGDTFHYQVQDNLTGLIQFVQVGGLKFKDTTS